LAFFKRPDNVKMSTNKLFSKITNRLQLLIRKLRIKSAYQQNGDAMLNLIHMLENTEDIELSCDEVYAIIDHYVELEARGEDAARILPLVRKHLDNCRDCFEEYEALSRILAAYTTPGG
jgi:hypothetical protein